MIQIGDIVKAQGKRQLVVGKSGSLIYVIPEKSDFAKEVIPLIESGLTNRQLCEAISFEKRKAVLASASYLHESKAKLIKSNNFKIYTEVKQDGK